MGKAEKLLDPFEDPVKSMIIVNAIIGNPFEVRSLGAEMILSHAIQESEGLSYEYLGSHALPFAAQKYQTYPNLKQIPGFKARPDTFSKDIEGFCENILTREWLAAAEINKRYKKLNCDWECFKCKKQCSYTKSLKVVSPSNEYGPNIPVRVSSTFFLEPQTEVVLEMLESQEFSGIRTLEIQDKSSNTAKVVTFYLHTDLDFQPRLYVRALEEMYKFSVGARHAYPSCLFWFIPCCSSEKECADAALANAASLARSVRTSSTFWFFYRKQNLLPNYSAVHAEQQINKGALPSRDPFNACWNCGLVDNRNLNCVRCFYA